MGTCAVAPFKPAPGDTPAKWLVHFRRHIFVWFRQGRNSHRLRQAEPATASRRPHHASRWMPFTASKWASRLAIGKWCWRASAAIQMSFSGIGCPPIFSSCRIWA